MSIVALKRNSRRFQVSISGKGNNGFALNGTHRNIGAVGVTNLAKSQDIYLNKHLSENCILCT